jgi:hypothetical protein
MNSHLDPSYKLQGLANLAGIGVDVTAQAMIMSKGKPAPLVNIVQSLPDNASLFLAVDRHHWLKHSYHLSRIRVFASGNVLADDIRQNKHEFVLEGTGMGHDNIYDHISEPFDAPKNRNSAYGVLIDCLRRARYEVNITGPEVFTLGIYAGPPGGRSPYSSIRDLVAGAEIKEFGLVLEVRKMT